MEHRKPPTALVVVSVYLFLGAFAIVAAAALIAWSRMPPERPRPLVDRSSEIENIVAVSLGEQFGSAEVKLVRYDPAQNKQRGVAATGSAAEGRGWRYEGWYELRGSRVKLPLVAGGSDHDVMLELERMRNLVGDAGGRGSFVQLVAEFDRALPREAVFYPKAYAGTFSLARCSSARHSRIPSLVQNRYGQFVPRNVFFHAPPGAAGPTAVFAWNEDKGEWRCLGGPDAVGVFENVWIHSGCDVSEEDWYARRKTMPGTKVLAY